MKTARIHVIWIRGKVEEKNGETATWRFFKTLVRSIDQIQRKFLSSHGAIHFRISQRTGSTPILDWCQSSLDRPKGSR